VPGNVRRQVAIKKRQRGFDEATCVVLQAAGGNCPGGFEALREDPGLAGMLGHDVPSPEAARIIAGQSLSSLLHLLRVSAFKTRCLVGVSRAVVASRFRIWTKRPRHL